MIVFDHEHLEPGCSGGPIFAINGGGVVGVMIQLADNECRATSLLSFVNAIQLPNAWKQIPYPLGST